MKVIEEKIGDQIFDIYIGKNAKENWELIDNSDPFDLWFHVEDLPSGHIVIKERFCDKLNYPNYPNQIISLAANYCKSQSKYKNTTKLKIVYTEISNLKKGKEVGSVYIKNPEYIFV